MSAHLPSESSQPKIDSEMDDKIGNYSKLLDTVSDSEKPNLMSKLLGAKLMKEKLVAMTALAKAHSILAEMEVLVAESDLKIAIESLDKFKQEVYIEPVAISNSKENKTQKFKPSKETKKSSSKEALKNDSRSQRPLNIGADKENVKTQIRRTATPRIEDGQKVQISRSNTPTMETSNKRKHSNSSSSASNKRAKSSHTSSESKSASQTSKNNSHITKAVQTCGSYKNLEKVLNRIVDDDDDETTILIQTLSEGTNLHRNNASFSKALQQVISPKTRVKPQELTTYGVTQRPVASKMLLLFKDEPKDTKKCHTEEVKMEEPDNGDDVL